MSLIAIFLAIFLLIQPEDKNDKKEEVGSGWSYTTLTKRQSFWRQQKTPKRYIIRRRIQCIIKWLSDYKEKISGTFTDRNHK